MKQKKNLFEVSPSGKAHRVSGFASFKRFNETWVLCACVYGKRKKEELSTAGKHETVRNKIGFVG